MSYKEMEIFNYNRLAELVNKHEASLEDISFFLHISHIDLEAYINGVSVPDGQTFRKIALMFNVKPEFLMHRSPQTLRELRWFMGLSLPQAGTAWGLSPSLLHNIEEGRRNLTQRSAEILSKSLNLPIEKIYELAQEKTFDTENLDATSHVQEEIVQLLKNHGIVSANFRGKLSHDVLEDIRNLVGKLDSNDNNTQKQ